MRRIIGTIILSIMAVAALGVGTIRHADIGEKITKAEFESTSLHFIEGGAAGDILYGSTTGTLVRLPAGAAGQVLVVATGTPRPAWITSSVIATPIPTPTPNNFEYVEAYLQTAFSAGRLWGGEITPNVDGTVDIAAGAGLIKTETAAGGLSAIPGALNEGQASTVTLVSWNAIEDFALGVSDGYYLIYWDASEEEMTYSVRADFYDDFDFITDFTIGRCYKTGTEVVERLCGMNMWDFPRRVQMFGEERFPVERASGLVIGATGLTYSVSDGVIWAELVNRFPITGKLVGDSFTYWYQIEGVWNSTTATSIDATNYNKTTGDADGLLAMTNANRWRADYVYVVHDGSHHVVMGQAEATSQANAELIAIPTPPGLLGAYASLVGRITVRKTATTMTADSAYADVFSAAAIPDHNGLAGLQGGGTDERYHMTAAQATALATATPAPISENVSGGLAVGTGATIGTNYRTAIGKDALSGGQLLDYSTAVGIEAGRLAYDGSHALLGYQAGMGANADKLTAVGYQALKDGSGAELSTAIGYGAGNTWTGENLTAIGYQAGKYAGDHNNTLAIGYGVFATEPNMAVIGGTGGRYYSKFFLGSGTSGTGGDIQSVTISATDSAAPTPTEEAGASIRIKGGEGSVAGGAQGSVVIDAPLTIQSPAATPVALVTVASDGKVGIGTASPANDLSVRPSGSTTVRIGPSSSGFSFLDMIAHGSGNVVEHRFTLLRGDVSTPTVTSDNDELMRLNAYGGINATPSSGYPAARIRVYQDGASSATRVPGRIVFETSPGGTTTPQVRMTIKNDGSVFMPDVYSDDVGAVRPVYIKSDGQLGYNSSTIDAKENVVTLPNNSARTLLALRPVTYDRRDGTSDGEVGLIAEEVAQVWPQAVFYDEPTTGTFVPAGIDYSRLVAPMLKLIQAQEARITALEARLTKLEGAR